MATSATSTSFISTTSSGRYATSWPGKKVLLAPRWIQHIDWKDGKVQVNLPREVIQNAPEYDPTQIFTRQYEESLGDYYEKYLGAQSNIHHSLLEK